jgi:very-short-patch-repair endonuclease
MVCGDARPVSAVPLPLPVPGWPVVFRGSDAVRAGLATKAQLRGPRYLRLFPDVYVPVGAKLPDLKLRSLAAHEYGRRRGVLSGYSAAELLDASCGPRDAPAELTVPGGRVHPHTGLELHGDALLRRDVQTVRGVHLTTPLRTAYDLARWCDELVEAVVAVDRLSNKAGFAPEEVLRMAERYPRARGRKRLPRVVDLADRRAGSPMETRLRLVLVLRGLPRPEVQWVVQDERRRLAVWLDLAYPEHKIGIEFEGDEHTKPERVLRDNARGTDLVDDGWRLYRFTKHEVYGEPDEIAAKIDRALSVRSH